MLEISSIKNFKEWLGWFTNEIKTALHEKRTAYRFRLTEIKYSPKSGHEICVVQVVGKNIFPEISPCYLAEHAEILNEFPAEDIITISRLAERIERNIQSTQLSIRELNVNTDFSNRTVTVSQTGKIEHRVLALDHIENNNLISQFSPEDAYLLGRLKEGLERSRDRELMPSAKKSHGKWWLFRVK